MHLIGGRLILLIVPARVIVFVDKYLSIAREEETQCKLRPDWKSNAIDLFQQSYSDLSCANDLTPVQLFMS